MSNNQVLCSCCDCVRECVGFNDMNCAEIFVEVKDIEMAAMTFPRTDLAGYPEDFYAGDYWGTKFNNLFSRYFSTNFRADEFNSSDTDGPETDRASGQWGKELFYSPGETLACGIRLRHTNSRFNNPDFGEGIWCDGIRRLPGIETVAYGVRIRLRPDGDVDAYGDVNVYGSIPFFAGGGGTLSLGFAVTLNTFFYGKVTPPEGWIDPTTGEITSDLVIANTLSCSDVGTAFDLPTYGLAPTPDDPLLARRIVGGGGGSVVIRASDSTFPVDWRTNYRAYRAGTVTCPPMTGPADCVDEDPDDNDPPVGDPPYDPPLPPRPPGGPGDSGKTRWVEVLLCSDDTPLNYWVNADETAGTVFERNNLCVKATGRVVERNRPPGPVLRPNEFFADCWECHPYYLLTNCDDASTIITDSDLADEVGNVVELDGETGCWTVTEYRDDPDPTHETVTVTDSHESCEDCEEVPAPCECPDGLASSYVVSGEIKFDGCTVWVPFSYTAARAGSSCNWNMNGLGQTEFFDGGSCTVYNVEGEGIELNTADDPNCFWAVSISSGVGHFMKKTEGDTPAGAYTGPFAGGVDPIDFEIRNVVVS